MLIRRASLLDGARVDIRVSAEIDEVGDTLTAKRGEDVLDAAGGTVMPGLHDHHVHLRSAAAVVDSLSLGPPQVHTKDQLMQVLSSAAPGADGWIRGVGYHESVAGPLDRGALDAAVSGIPVRVQDRSGALWILNSAALGRIGMAEHPDGRLRSADRGWSRALQRRETDLSQLSRRLTAVGVTGVTDATPDLEAADMVSLILARRRGEFRPRLRFLAPGKKILHDDSLDLDYLAGWIAIQHNADRPVAVHCVTAAQLVLTIAAFRIAGSHRSDRIEHAAVVPSDCLADLTDLAGLGLTVVTQPNFVAERGDQYLAQVPVAEHDQLWRLASLVNADVPVGLSTDMPFGRGDPWAVMRAAVHRRTPSGATLNAVECVSARAALGMFLGRSDQPGRARTIRVGEPGDLCVLTEPPAAALAELDPDLVSATIIDGEVAYAAQ
ncbi:amidohydrolase family protein [Mycobacterium spongiae]|uniref:Amidohydrolase family protein n=1 Tax=Mycobacterium spongiae TaxID=886343 RepID=A0A975PVP7_9MYCO|nr:amidohydrolase family protein [Mycobacterium spongiae]QUR65969.1 amidohydrolase family protein [Mycobacterium spongiae]